MNSDLPQVGGEAYLDTSDYNKQIDDAIKRAKKFDVAMDELSGTATLKVNADDSELVAAARVVNDIEATTANVKVNADDSEVDDVSDKLDDLVALSVIDLALNVSGSAIGFVESLGRFSGLGGLIEMDNALSQIEGRTGRMIPQAEQLINDLYTNGWGESRDQIAGVIVEASNLKIANEDLEEATFNAFQVAAVTGGETNEVLRSMNTLVKNDLVDSYSDAADLIVTGFQTGNDRGQDLLDTFNEYGSTFSQLGIDGEGALSLINSGLDAGIDNSDRIADAIRETGIRLGEIGTDENIANAFSQLDDLSDIDLASALDAYQAGEMSGNDFFEAFFQAIKDANAADPQQAQTLAATLVGTISEDFGVEAISQLSPEWDTAMGSLEGRATEAGTAISDNLGTSIESFFRAVEVAATDFLSSDTLNLDEKLDTFKDQLQTALATLQSGGSLGEALEIGFGIGGVDDALSNIQRVFGQLVISLLEILATVQDPLGITDNDKGTRAEIARLSEGQLAFDLQIANADELGTLVDQALNRGVSAEGVMTAIGTALDEAVAGGDFDQVVDLLDAFTQEALATGADPAVVSEFVASYTDQLSTGFDEAIASGDFSLAKKIADAQHDPTAYTDALAGVFNFNTATLDAQVAAFNEGMTMQIEDELQSPQDAWRSSVEAWAAAAEESVAATEAAADAESAINASNASVADASLAAALVYAASQEAIAENSRLSAEAAEAMDRSIANSLTENTVTASFEAVAESADENFPIVNRWIDQVIARIAALDQKSYALSSIAGRFATLAGEVASFPTEQMQSILNASMGFAGAQTVVNNGGNTTNNNVTVNNNPQNNAQAQTDTYTLGRAIAG